MKFTTFILLLMLGHRQVFGYRPPQLYRLEDEDERDQIEHRRYSHGQEGRYHEMPERYHRYNYMNRNGNVEREERDYELKLESMVMEETKRKMERRQIQQCELDIENCPYSAEELVDKILEQEDDEWKQDLTNEQYRPNARNSIERSRVEAPAIDSISLLQPSRDFRRKVASLQPIEGQTRISSQCQPNCVRYKSSGKYKINCRDCLKDTSVRYFYQRKRKMISCFKCRTACSRANVNIYI
ncbi:uncharacterized protein LOC144420972 [Styela clava]